MQKVVLSRYCEMSFEINLTLIIPKMKGKDIFNRMKINLNITDFKLYETKLFDCPIIRLIIES
jgi:hypothetical protein